VLFSGASIYRWASSNTKCPHPCRMASSSSRGQRIRKGYHLFGSWLTTTLVQKLVRWCHVYRVPSIGHSRYFFVVRIHSVIFIGLDTLLKTISSCRISNFTCKPPSDPCSCRFVFRPVVPMRFDLTWPSDMLRTLRNARSAHMIHMSPLLPSG